MDIQATNMLVDWTIKGITILLMIVAASIAIKKKKNLVLAFAIFGNLILYYLTLSPLLCMIVSIVCIVWANSVKTKEQNEQPLKSSGTSTGEKRKMVKTGSIIYIIIGICLIVFPIYGFINQEPSMMDSTGHLLGIGFIIFGALMVIGNIIALIKGPEQETAASAPVVQTVATAVKAATREKRRAKKMIRCRFCKKLYSSEYNGCPYCKKK